MSSTVEIHPHSAGDWAPRHFAPPWSRPVTPRHVDELFADEGPASEQRRDFLKSSPAFPAAVRCTAQALVEHHRGNRILNAIISDRGRFFAALFVLDLHFRRHDEGIGLTPGRLKEQCVEQDICSATRAGALLALMKLGGYVEAAPRGRDRRLRELVPTDKLISQQQARWSCYLVGAAPFLPAAARALDMIEQPEFVQGVVRLMSAHFRAGFRFNDHAPGLRLFSERNGGMFMLFSLLAAAEPGGHTPIPISISELARSISASRVHVLKLLKDAETEGLLRRVDQGTVVLMPALERDAFEFFALGKLLLTHFATITLDHIRA